MPIGIALRSMLLALASVAVVSAASGADTVKVAIGQIDAWANQAPTLGMKAGIFQKHGIVPPATRAQGQREWVRVRLTRQPPMLPCSEWFTPPV